MNVTSTALKLDSLGFNGGTTKTMLPGYGSVAIHAGNPNDSRDAQNSKVYGGNRDAGAAERYCYVEGPKYDIEACQYYLFFNDSFTMSGAYYDTLASASNCDSIITLNLTIVDSFVETRLITTCDYYKFNNDSLITNGIYRYSFNSTKGCDSIIYIDLSLKDTLYSSDTVYACDLFVHQNDTFFQSTIYRDTLATNKGCDSVHMLNINIFKSTLIIDTVVACDYFMYNGDSVISSGLYKDSFMNRFGCDSIIALDLTLNYASIFIDSQTHCDSFKWMNGVTYYSSTDTPSYQLMNMHGCDSTIFLDLTILNSSVGVDSQLHCDSFTWINGVTYYASTNNVLDTIANKAGCDSVVRLALNINYSTSFTDVQTSCDSFTWINGITYYASTNLPQDTLINAAGCDSVINLNLTILHSSYFNDVQEHCDSFTWIDGVTYYSSTNASTYTTVNADGCDSINSLDLTIKNSSAYIDYQVHCDSFTWIDGVTYFSSTNSPIYTLVNTQGCDSIMSLNLTISTVTKDVISGSDDTAICGENFTLEAGLFEQYYWSTGDTSQQIMGFTSGQYWVEVSDSNGCFKSDTIDVTLNDIPSIDFGNDTALCGDSIVLTWFAAGSKYHWSTGDTLQYASITSSNNYWLEITDSNGCKNSDTIQIALWSNIAKPEITLDGSVIYSDISGEHVWFKDEVEIVGESDSFISIAGEEGAYFAVQIDSNGCYSDTSNTIVKMLGIEIQESGTLKVYPNPTRGMITVDFGNLPVSDISSIQLFDYLGQEIEIAVSNLNSSTSNITWDVSSGVLWLVVKTKTATLSKRVIYIK